MTFGTASLWIGAALAALLAAGVVAQRVCEASDSARYPPPGRLVDIGGRRLHLLCKGEGSGPTVVIEQGLAEPSILWWPVQDRVAEFARVCTYDRAGFLWSDPAPGVDTEASVADLRALLSAARVPGPYVLVGHSYGGVLVRLYARRHPGEVAGVVLVDVPPENVLFGDAFPSYNRSLRRMFSIAQGAARFGIVRLAAALQRPTPGIAPDAAQVMRATMARASFYRAARDASSAIDRIPMEMREAEALGTLGNLPLSVITHGVSFPGMASVLEAGWAEGQKRLAELSTDSELIVATKSNHMINIDEPELVTDAIRRVHATARDHARLQGFSSVVSQ